MKHLFALLLPLLAAARPALAQQPARYTVRPLRLPSEIEYYDNQFSGLNIAEGKLFIMSESRLQDKAEAKLYAVALPDLERQLADSTYALPYRKMPLLGLPALRRRIDAAGDGYEGLEAILIDHATVYLTVETPTPAANCYLLRGRLGAEAVTLDTTFLLPLRKPTSPSGAHIYNAGFEALAATHRQLFAFFEYNSFADNYVYEVNKKRLGGATVPEKRVFDQLPYRVTDITATGPASFVGINYFFKGEGGDAVYRTPAADTASARRIGGAGDYRNYCRLIRISMAGDKFGWQPLWEFPVQYRSYNWEGLAAYKDGFFVINDKYTPAKPYKTTLLYLQAR